MAEISREYNFRSEKMIFDNKTLERYESFLRKKTKFMTSYLYKQNCEFLKFRILNNLKPLIMCTKFQISQIILTLFSEVGDKNPPRSWENHKMP